jgi:hypothetical protein
MERNCAARQCLWASRLARGGRCHNRVAFEFAETVQAESRVVIDEILRIVGAGISFRGAQASPPVFFVRAPAAAGALM